MTRRAVALGLRWTGRGAVLLLLGLASCGSDSGAERKEPETRADRRLVVENDGAVCLTPQEDGRVAVDVAFGTCLSSSCDTAENVTCETELSGDRIAITSHLEKVTPGRFVDCPTDCNQVKAACGVLEPLAGSRVLVHGQEESEPVTFPLTEAVQLFPSLGNDCEYASYERSFR